jgi:hypothetical protein
MRILLGILNRTKEISIFFSKKEMKPDYLVFKNIYFVLMMMLRSPKSITCLHGYFPTILLKNNSREENFMQIEICNFA